MLLGNRKGNIVPWLVALGLGFCWAAREHAYAEEKSQLLKAQTVNLADLKMNEIVLDGRQRGEVGFYLQGATPSTRSFVVGQARLKPGEEPHPVHTHADEEVLIVTSGTGEVYCNGNKTNVGPGSVMYTDPNAPHGIKNTGGDVLTFYFVKWVGVQGK